MAWTARWHAIRWRGRRNRAREIHQREPHDQPVALNRRSEWIGAGSGQFSDVWGYVHVGRTLSRQLRGPVQDHRDWGEVLRAEPHRNQEPPTVVSDGEGVIVVGNRDACFEERGWGGCMNAVCRFD